MGVKCSLYCFVGLWYYMSNVSDAGQLALVIGDSNVYWFGQFVADSMLPFFVVEPSTPLFMWGGGGGSMRMSRFTSVSPCHAICLFVRCCVNKVHKKKTYN